MAPEFSVALYPVAAHGEGGETVYLDDDAPENFLEIRGKIGRGITLREEK